MSENKNSQYDPGLIIKEVHDFYGQSIRTIDSSSITNSSFSHFNVVYNTLNLPKEVSYYRGISAQKTTIGCVSDINGSLQNSYIGLNSCPDNKKYHIWFNVDSLGVDPAPANSIPIEIQINSNDSAPVIALAISLTLNTLYKEIFYTSRINSVLEISTVGLGLVDPSFEVGTGFAISNILGKQNLVGFIEIDYEGLNPIYKGQVLKGYRFNVFTGQFEHKEEAAASPTDVLWDEIITTLPSNIEELYTYKLNSNLIQEVLVTYADASKRLIVSVQKTRY
jgi:hypothetical protein